MQQYCEWINDAVPTSGTVSSRSRSNPIGPSIEQLMDTYGLDGDEDRVDRSDVASDTQSIEQEFQAYITEPWRKHTPSNVLLLLEEVKDTCHFTFVGGLIPCIRAATLVILGAMVETTVEVTVTVVKHLCLGTSMKFCTSYSLIGTTLAPLVLLYAMPAQTATTFIVHSEISGSALVDGTTHACKAGLPLGFCQLVVEVEGMVADDRVYPCEVVCCKLDRTDKVREPSGSWSTTDGLFTLSQSLHCILHPNTLNTEIRASDHRKKLTPSWVQHLPQLSCLSYQFVQ